MTTTDQQRRAVAYLVRAVRSDFDEPGVMAVLAKVQHLDLAMVVMAAMRCAAEASIKTPAMIGDPTSSVYRERVGPERAPAREPYDAATFCGICSEPRGRCEERWSSDHDYEPAWRSRARKGEVDLHPVVVELKGHL